MLLIFTGDLPIFATTEKVQAAKLAYPQGSKAVPPHQGAGTRGALGALCAADTRWDLRLPAQPQKLYCGDESR